MDMVMIHQNQRNDVLIPLRADNAVRGCLNFQPKDSRMGSGVLQGRRSGDTQLRTGS